MENLINNDLELNLSRELEIKVTSWLHTAFNFISINVLNKLTENRLIDYIYFGETSDYLIRYLDDSDEIILIIDYCEQNLIDNIDDKVAKYQDFYGTIKESFISCISDDWEGFCLFVLGEYDDDIREFIYEYNEDKFPIKANCFEFRDLCLNENIEVLDKSIKVGFFVVHGIEYLNRLLLVPDSENNYIFKYFVPLYLELFPAEKEKYGHLQFNSK